MVLIILYIVRRSVDYNSDYIVAKEVLDKTENRDNYKEYHLYR